MRIRIFSIAVALAVLSSPSFAQNEKTISVIAWNLVQPALDKLIPVFEKKTGYQAGARAMLEFLGSAEANAVYRELNMETVP